jgi:hypothetical protein
MPFTHVVVVLFENRSVDSVLAHLYGPRTAIPLRALSGRT